MLKIYAIKDQKAEAFNTPFFNATHGQAERNFQELCNDKNSFVAKYPKDYDLYHLGEYDERTGKIVPLDAPVHLVAAAQLISSDQKVTTLHQ